ncbi:MAG: FAD-dependent thymidylate synthase [Lachnospiraceae bacterium]|nr:FAD-dependent thymidylate synthase [Lachnospiraceae bacterium]
MGKVTVMEGTTKEPITLIGKMAGICYGSDVKDPLKNYKRGMGCIESNHGRTLEFPEVYLELSGYSARVIREYYTHIAGGPTRLQASTRYINYENGFDYITPPKIQNNEEALKVYDEMMKNIQVSLKKLEDLGIPKEDSAMGLPLGMTTVIVDKRGLRSLIEMSHQRLCTRAYWEFRNLMNDIMKALKEYSEEWAWLVDNLFMPKCEYLGRCPEKTSCGRYSN